MLFTPISLRIIYSVEGENPPSPLCIFFLRYRRALQSGAKPMSQSPPHPFTMETFILPSAFCTPLLLFRFHLPLPLSILLHSLSFHYCYGCEFSEHMWDISMMYVRLHWGRQTEAGWCHAFFLLFNVVLVGTHTQNQMSTPPPSSLFELCCLSLPENMQHCMETDASF